MSCRKQNELILFVENPFYNPSGTLLRSAGMCNNIRLSPASLCGRLSRDGAGFGGFHLPEKHGACCRAKVNCFALCPAPLTDPFQLRKLLSSASAVFRVAG